MLTDVRTELATTLAPLGVNVYDHLPGRAALPSAIVLAGSPYVTPGQAYGEYIARFDVWISAATGDNNTETAQLDDLISSAVAALAAEGWTAEEVSQPFSFEINNGTAYTATITVTSLVTL
ncbi:MAG: hypothetical protein QM677_02490 [Microbacterium sp.]